MPVSSALVTRALSGFSSRRSPSLIAPSQRSSCATTACSRASHSNRCAVLDERSEIGFQRGARQRCGQSDQRLALASVEIRDDEELGLRDALRFRQARSASACQQITTAGAARLRDAIRIREGEQPADVGVRLRGAGPRSARIELALENFYAAQRPLPGATVDTNVCGDVRIVDASAAQRFDAQAQIGVAAAAAPAQQVALAQYRRNLQCEALQSELGAAHDHVGQSRMGSQPCQRTTVRRDPAVRIDRIERAQQVARLRERCSRRRIEPAQAAWIDDTPLGQVERDRREIRFENLRRGVRGQRSVLTLRPQAIAHARAETAGTAASLIGGRARDPHSLQAAHSSCRIEARATCESGIDDDANAFDRQTGLRDVGGEYDFAVLRVAGSQRRVLFDCGQIAEERQHGHWSRQAVLFELLLRATDLRLPRQKRQDVASVVLDRLRDRSRRPHGDVDVARAAVCSASSSGPVRLDFERSPFRSHDRRVAEQPCDGGRIERRGHHQDPQVLANFGLRIQTQREPEVGIEAALVKFVEDHQRDAFERRRRVAASG